MCGRRSDTEAPLEAAFQAKDMWDVTANTVRTPSTPAQVGHVKTSTDSELAYSVPISRTEYRKQFYFPKAFADWNNLSGHGG